MKTSYGPFVVLIALLGILLGLDHAGIAPRTGAPVADAGSVVDTGPMTSVEKSYLEFAINHLQTVGEDIVTLGVLFSAPAMEDDHWKASVTVLLNRIERAHESIAALEPTERLQPFQAASISALEHAAAFAKALRVMLAAGTTTLSDEAAQAYAQTREGFDEVDALLQEFLGAHPAPGEPTASAASGS